MTKTFPTKDAALSYGIFCARGYEYITPIKLKRLEDRIMKQFGHVFPIEVYEVENSEGNMTHLGVEKFRDGFALWLMTPGSPLSFRV